MRGPIQRGIRRSARADFRFHWAMPLAASLAVFVLLTGCHLLDSPPAPGFTPEPLDVIAVVPRDFPPEYFLDESGQPAGFAIDVMDRVAALAGLRVTYLVEDTWADVNAAMSEGRADLIPNSGITPERQADYAFTHPIETFSISVFVRTNTLDIHNLDDLTGRKVGVLGSNAAGDLLREREVEGLIVFGEADRALFALLSGNIDALAYPEPVLWEIAASAGVENQIQTVGEPLAEIRRAIAVHRDDTELLERLNRAVEEFVGTEAYQRIYLKWYGLPPPFWTPARMAALGGGGFLLVVAAMVVWRYRSLVTLNRQLSASISARQQAEEGLHRSEADLKKAHHVAHIGSWTWHIKDNRLEWSDEMFDIFGLDKDAFSGSLPDVVAQAIHPDDREKVEASNLAVIQDKNPQPLEYRVIWPDQSVHTLWGEAGELVLDEAGKPAVLSGIVQDITERKKAEQALHESSALLQAIIDASPIAIVVIDASDQVILWNPAAERMYGYKKDEVQGKRLPVTIDKPETEFAEFTARRMTGKFRSEVEVQGRRKDGGAIDVLLSTAPIYSADGKQEAILRMQVDITDRKLAERALQDSETRNRAILETIPDLMFVLSSDGIHLDYYASLKNQLLLDPETFMSKSVTEVLPEPVAAAYMEHIGKALSTEGVQVFEYPLTFAEDDVREFEARMLRSGEDRVLAVVRNITDRKRADRALRESEERYRLLLDNFAGILYEVAPNTFSPRLFQGASREITGYDGSEFTEGRVKWSDIVDPDDLDMLRGEITKLLADPDYLSNIEYRIRRKDGEIRWVRNLEQRAPSPDESTILLQGVVIDVTEAREAEEELRRHRDQLEELVAERTASLEEANRQLYALSKVKDEFVANVSHELRTPITSLKLYHRLLTLKPDARETNIERIGREINRLAYLIEDLLHLARLDANRTEVSLVEVDLNRLLADYVADRGPLAQERGLRLEIDLDSTVPPVLADAGLIGQVMSILLTNAITYTPSGGTVTVRTQFQPRNGGRARAGFSITDSGPGILPDDLPHLFERFYRGKAGHDAKLPGTGLGLAIAHEIVSRHGGEIDIDPGGQDGKGATFTVWLPA